MPAPPLFSAASPSKNPEGQEMLGGASNISLPANASRWHGIIKYTMHNNVGKTVRYRILVLKQIEVSGFPDIPNDKEG